MKIKIGDKIYSSADQPIMVIMSPKERELISNMHEDARKFCCYPADPIPTPEEVEAFMEIKEPPSVDLGGDVG